MSLLTVDNLHTYYGNIHALKGVSLTVNQGEIVTLIGANGAGKSTTLRTISGLLAPRQGSIVFGGENIAGQPAHTITGRGLVQAPEGRRVFSQLTVQENLELGAYLRNSQAEVRADIERVFELFPRLRERRRQVSGTLSGGEQQMLAIAMAAARRPAVLLLDEPTQGLAPSIYGILRETFDKLTQEGIALLIAEQNIPFAASIASRCMVLRGGRLILNTGPELLEQPAKIAALFLGEDARDVPASHSPSGSSGLIQSMALG
ncbi:MAG TPA: ABC transporter ATP-binding protein [Caldilineaceae bacterium]|nr:ABC transporter ATP-binding protein [Caldilineaceae bacterium]